MKTQNPTALIRFLKRLKYIHCLWGMILCVIITGARMQAYGAIEWSSNVAPYDPRTWTLNDYASIPYSGSSGYVTVNNGSQLFSYAADIGEAAGSTGTVTVTGKGSKWTCKEGFYMGFSGNGVLNIEAGGEVSNIEDGAYMGWSSQSTATVHVTGEGSSWTPHALHISMNGKATITIDAGGNVTTPYAYLGENGINSGTVTVSGAGSKFVSDYARVGDYGSTGILNIGTGKASGGLVAIKSIACAINQSTSKAIFNLNGGTLQMGTMQKYSGSVDFNWSDGTIQNYDTATNLTISGTNNLILKLAATGTHAFNLDAGRTGTISAVLSDATSGGTLTKTGLGILTLTATNTYSGDTYLEAGTLSISNRYLNDWASVHIASGAKFDLNYSGIDTVNSLYLDGLPMVSGTWGSSLSNATHIDNLHFSGTGKLNVTNVPEPSTMALLLTATLGGLLWWRRRR